MSGATMSEVSINEWPHDYIKVFETPLFFQNKYLEIGGHDHIISFYLLRKISREIVGEIVFVIKDNEAVSLPGSPFGGFMLGNVVSEELSFFIEKIVASLKALKIKKILIKNASQIFHTHGMGMIENVLKTHQFQISWEDINHHIVINDQPFYQQLHLMELRKWRKSQDANYQFSQYGIGKLEDVYHFIADCRKEKGLVINIDFKKLVRSFAVFPEHYYAFVLQRGNEIFAATIAVKINQSTLYNYLPASSIKTNKESPMVYLLDNLYQYCQKIGFSILDLGVSSIQGHRQEGLIHFKEHVGGLPTKKLTLVYS